MAGDLVRATYGALLGRVPDPHGLAHGRQILAGEAGLQGLIAELLDSQEFRDRAEAERREAEAPESVTRLFRLLLQREPEPQALAHFADLATRASPEAVLAELIESPEFLGRVLLLHHANVVAASYRALLGRVPDPHGLAHGRQILAGEAGLQGLIAELLDSQEFRDRAEAERREAEAPESVTRLFRLLLQREPEPQALAHFADLATRASPEAVLAELIESPEFLGRVLLLHHANVVAASYRALLGRVPDPHGLAHGRQILAGEAGLQGLIAELLDSQEFRDRAEAERREAEAPESVTRLFRLLLQREPEPQALAHFADLATRASPEAVLAELIESPEFLGRVRDRLPAWGQPADSGPPPVLRDLAEVVSMIQDFVSARLFASGSRLQLGGPVAPSTEPAALKAAARALLMSATLCPSLDGSVR
ncbi:hypothetical protein [Methylobacterium durans]|uniref:DUF4214 domain-containing protein n=1 Tax=Methylobacterium durans TaxID=2202825 RepID=A0A2U8W302_9HYPH|nr:hypothetical protein [Methylobacterium durans]AWN39900.1 hypothetical protein DK389_04300 [Methylobacterium durans]